MSHGGSASPGSNTNVWLHNATGRDTIINSKYHSTLVLLPDQLKEYEFNILGTSELMVDHAPFQKLNEYYRADLSLSHHTKSYISVPTKVTRNKTEAVCQKWRSSQKWSTVDHTAIIITLLTQDGYLSRYGCWSQYGFLSIYVLYLSRRRDQMDELVIDQEVQDYVSFTVTPRSRAS